jgi:hypothetical protein
MARGVGKRKHCSPRVAHDNWMTVAPAFLDKVVQVLDVRRDQERPATAASLVRLEHAPTPSQLSGKRCNIARGSGSTVQRSRRRPRPGAPRSVQETRQVAGIARSR